LPALERIEREKEQEQKDSYLKQCCQALTDEIMEIVRNVTSNVATDLRTIAADRSTLIGSISGGSLDAKILSMKKILSSTHLKSMKERIN
jgi:hypothetical protein